MEQNKEEKSKVANPMSHVEFESKMGIYIGTVAANGSLSGPVSEKIISLAYDYASQFKEQRDELLKLCKRALMHHQGLHSEIGMALREGIDKIEAKGAING